MDTKSLQSGDDEDQSDAHVENRLQAKREREVDGGEDTDCPGAPATTGAHVQVEGRSDFLQPRSVKSMEPSKLANTYRDDRDDDISNPEVGQTSRMTVDSGGADVDGGNDLGCDLLGALVVPASSELGEDGVTLVAERVEGTDDVVVGPLRDDFGDSTGEGNDTSGEDSEDGGETHGEEVC